MTTKEGFSIKLTTVYEKGSKVNRKFLPGYTSYAAADDDIHRLLQHLQDGRRFQSFETTLSSARNLKKRPNESSERKLFGCVSKRRKLNSSIRYRRYLRDIQKAEVVPIERVEWDQMYNIRGPDAIARAARQFSRNPVIRIPYLFQLLRDTDDSGVKNSIAYIKERVKTLAIKITFDKKKIHEIREESFSGTCYNLLMKAKLEEDDGLVDLTNEPDFTIGNVSKEQLARVCMQSMLVSSIYVILIKRSQSKTALLQNEFVEISAHKGSIESLKDLLQKHLMALREFKQTNSIAIIAEEAIEESNRKISARTLRKWYNEFEEFNKFKEDLRGCYEIHLPSVSLLDWQAMPRMRSIRAH